VEASWQLQVLVLIAVVAAATVTTLKFYEDREIRDIALWLQRTYPQTWDSLPWVVRNANRAAAVEAFRENPEIDDPEIERRYALARQGRKWQGVALAVAILALAAAVAGHQLLGWTLVRGETGAPFGSGAPAEGSATDGSGELDPPAQD
jgi:hypothetical protein